MKDFNRSYPLFSLCGLNCGLCSMHIDNYCPGCGAMTEYMDMHSKGGIYL